MFTIEKFREKNKPFFKSTIAVIFNQITYKPSMNHQSMHIELDQDHLAVRLQLSFLHRGEQTFYYRW